MQRNSKQVLLKYNTVERKTIEDDALIFRIKTLLRWFLLAVLIFFPFTFYVPFYFDDDGFSRKPADVVGWGLNTNRSVSLYVIPDNDTALIVGSKLCSEPLVLLIVVSSVVSHIQQRAIIRETWGSFPSVDYKIAFLLGTTDNITLQEAIEEESSIYNDIIQENFVDSYNNLTIKSIMMLKFFKNRCGQVEYLFKSDDDVFIYIPNLLTLIKLIKEKNLEHILLGKLICRAKPILRSDSKWYAPRYMFAEKVFPHYLSGVGYLMNRKTAIQLYDAALKLPIFHLEDIFITGLCARKAKIKPRHHPGFTYTKRRPDACMYIQNQNLINSHQVSVEYMKQVWADFNSTNATCTKSKNLIPAKLNLLPPSLGNKHNCF